mmetsp:Transcript_7258/g.26586  ORF Transcript_7258/g.26586 Transcript_7258/m.26586 type:complete len:80 (-) Transcript_7258:281-520(-)
MLVHRLNELFLHTLYADRGSPLRQVADVDKIVYPRQFQISRVKKRWNRVLPVGKFHRTFIGDYFSSRLHWRFTINRRKF